MEKKVTLKEQFAEVKAIVEASGRTDLVEFINGRIKQLEKKSASHKVAKVSAEDMVLINAVTEVLSKGKALTCSEIIKSHEKLSGLSTQKIRGILNKVEGMVSTKDGKKTVFSIKRQTETEETEETEADVEAEAEAVEAETETEAVEAETETEAEVEVDVE